MLAPFIKNIRVPLSALGIVFGYLSYVFVSPVFSVATSNISAGIIGYLSASVFWSTVVLGIFFLCVGLVIRKIRNNLLQPTAKVPAE